MINFPKQFRIICYISFLLTGCEKFDALKEAKDLATVNDSPLEVIPQKSNHLITISPQGYAASLQMSTSEYQSWIKNDDYSNYEKRTNLIKEVYKQFQDKFDFIFLIVNEERRPDNLGEGQFYIVSNDITGIVNGGAKESLINFCSEYGSTGKLQGTIALNQLNYLTNGPSLHELMHRYGNYIFDKSEIYRGEKRIQSNGYHWAIMGGNIPGQLGGFEESTLKELGNGQYQAKSFGAMVNKRNQAPYSDFELYLMGMIPLKEVAPFSRFEDIEYADGDANGANITQFTAKSPTVYNPQKIKAEFGERNPSNANSQKRFRSLVLVVTPHPLTTSEWHIIDTSSKIFGLNKDDADSNNYNFWEATKGIGYMQTGDLYNALVK